MGSLRHISLTWDSSRSNSNVERGRVLSIGNFDGLHLGHQKLLSHAREMAKSRTPGRKSTLLTFSPHPSFILRPRQKIGHLTTFAHFKTLLSEVAGLDDWMSLRFDEALARKTGEEFLEWLRSELTPAAICVGFNFSFGAGKTSGVSFLQAWGLKNDIPIVVTPEFHLPGGETVSSSQIRKLVAGERFAEASRSLGRPYSVRGVVEEGAKRGRGLGFPTINLDVAGLVLPPAGVYHTSVRLPNDPVIRASVSHLGSAETFTEGHQILKLETHILDFEQNLYGQTAEVILHGKIRDNRQFASIEELKTAISRDIDARRARGELA